MSSNIENLIAKAIRAADKSYLFEDYTKQARAVMLALKKENMAIVTHPATEDMLKAGVDAIPAGRVKPEAVAERIYTAMVQYKVK